MLLSTLKTAATDVIRQDAHAGGRGRRPARARRQRPRSRLRIEIAAGYDVREDFFRLAVRENWVIMELNVEAHSLEDVFHKLTVESK